MNKSESIVKLSVALAKFNSEVSSISKDAKNPFFKSDYVTLDKLIIATRDILQKNGLSILQMPLSKESGEIGIQTIVLHETGEFIETAPLFMTPVKNDPQGAGSLITYLRRYSYQAVLNLNTGEDDDGNASTFKETVSQKSILNDKQINRLYAIAFKAGFSREVVKGHMVAKYKIDSMDKLNKTQYDEMCTGYEKSIK